MWQAASVITAPVVLVVEEHTALLDVLIDALTWEGYEVVPARGANEAADILRNREVDLLVADPPPFDGAEAEIDALAEEFPDLPLVTLIDPGTVEQIYFGPWIEEGNRYILRRPFRLGDLLRACREAVGPLPDPEEAEEVGDEE